MLAELQPNPVSVLSELKQQDPVSVLAEQQQDLASVLAELQPNPVSVLSQLKQQDPVSVLAEQQQDLGSVLAELQPNPASVLAELEQQDQASVLAELQPSVSAEKKLQQDRGSVLAEELQQDRGSVLTEQQPGQASVLAERETDFGSVEAMRSQHEKIDLASEQQVRAPVQRVNTLVLMRMFVLVRVLCTKGNDKRNDENKRKENSCDQVCKQANNNSEQANNNSKQASSSSCKQTSKQPDPVSVLTLESEQPDIVSVLKKTNWHPDCVSEGAEQEQPDIVSVLTLESEQPDIVSVLELESRQPDQVSEQNSSMQENSMKETTVEKQNETKKETVVRENEKEDQNELIEETKNEDVSVRQDCSKEKKKDNEEKSSDDNRLDNNEENSSENYQLNEENEEGWSPGWDHFKVFRRAKKPKKPGRLVKNRMPVYGGNQQPLGCEGKQGEAWSRQGGAFGNSGPRGYSKLSPRCYAKTSPSPSPSPSELLGEIRPAKRHWETSPALWGEMGHASAVRSSFQMGIKFYSLFIDKMINWLSAAQEESREARSRSTATSRARGLETTALEAEAFEMEHLEASRCPAEMAMSEPSGAGEPSGATGDAQARASGSEDALEEATDGTPGSTSGSDSVWSISVQVGRELLGSHSYGCDCRRSAQVGRELLGSHCCESAGDEGIRGEALLGRHRL